MTKTNKTLLCVLLAMVLTFALALTALTTTAQTATAEGETADYTLTGSNFATAYPTTETTITIDANFSISVLNAATYDSGKTIQLKKSVGYIKFNNPIAKIKLTSASNVSVVDGSSTITGSNGEYTFSSGEAVQIKAGSNAGKITKIEVWLAVSHTCTAVEGAEWVKGETGHYHACSDSACPVTDITKKPDYAAHTFGGWTVDTSANKATRECTVCHKVEETDDLSVNVFVNGTIMKSSGTSTERTAEVTFGTKTVTVKITSDEAEIKQDNLLTVEFDNDDNSFNKANYNVTVEGGEFNWEDEKSGYLSVGNVKEVKITIVYICSHASQSYEHIAGTEKHKVVCAECGVTLVEEEACVATGENVATCMKEGKCDLCGGAIAKLAHGSEGCTHTAEEIIVLNAYGMNASSKPAADAQDVTITGVVCKEYASNKLSIAVGSLTATQYNVVLYRPTDNDKLPLANLKVGDVITVTGKLFKYTDGTIQFSAGSTYTNVVASKFEVSQSISAGDGAKEATDEASRIKTIYVKNGSQIVVTYAITENGGINTFIATLKYNKALFSIVSVTITDGFGAGAAVKSGTDAAVDQYKVYIEGDGEGYTANYTGEFVTVVYQFIGDTTATINASDFGLDEVTCYTNNKASGLVEAKTTIGSSNEVFDFIKQASISVEETSFVYNGKAITAIGKGEHDQIKVTADGEGAISYKWFTDGTYATEVAEGYEVKNAGKYYLKLIVATTAAFEGSELNVEITITPFDLKNADSEIVITANDKQVTGSALAWTVDELTINGGNLATARGYDSDENIFTATIAEHSLTTVGETKDVAVTLALNANYTYGGENSVATTVTLKVVAYANAWTTEPQNITKDFDNVKLDFAYAAENGTPVYYLGGEVKTAEELANAIVNAGTYEVKIVVEVVGYSNLEKTITITINKLKIDASSIVFDYSEDGKIKWRHPTKAIGSAGAIDLPTAVKFTYTLVDGKTENYGEDAVLEYVAQAEGAYTLNVIPGDAVNYEGTSTTTKTVYMITFAEGTHDGDNVIEGVAAYATVYRFDGQKAPAAPAAPVLAGYRFDGWTNNDMFGVAVTANIAHEAQWVRVYTITWYNEDGTSVLKTVTADVNTVVKFDGEKPTKAATDYIDYAFEKWVDTTDASKLYDLAYEFTLTADISVKATFKGTVARMSVSYKVVDGKGAESTETDLGRKAVGTKLVDLGLPELANYKWFKLSAWMNGETEFTTVVADELTGEHKIVLVATYTFNVGLGDVDGNGNVDTKDIVLYRKHIVGGYDITLVDDAWTTATAADFDENKVYFLAQVANVDETGENDVRDVSTIRMALVDGYGYTVKDGAVVKGNGATTQSAKVQYKQVLAPMGLFGKKFAL